MMRFDPFREADRVLDETWGGFRTRASVMPLDAYRHGHEYVVHLDLPGVDPSKVGLTVEKNVLTVSAERSLEPAEGDEVLIRERPQGSFTRQLYLGDGLDTDNIGADYRDGVLTIRVPVAEQARPRKVQITTQAGSGKPEAIDVESAPVGASA